MCSHGLVFALTWREEEESGDPAPLLTRALKASAQPRPFRRLQWVELCPTHPKLCPHRNSQSPGTWSSLEKGALRVQLVKGVESVLDFGWALSPTTGVPIRAAGVAEGEACDQGGRDGSRRPASPGPGTGKH